MLSIFLVVDRSLNLLVTFRHNDRWLTISHLFQAKETVDSAILVPLGTQMFWALCLSAIFCEAGEKMTIVWSDVDDEIEKIDWYFLSLEIQKSIIITMSFSQRVVQLAGLGSISGSRKIFKKVSSIIWIMTMDFMISISFVLGC